MSRLAFGSWLAGLALVVAAVTPAVSAPANRAFSAQARQARPHITIHPRREPGPNAKRYCRSWLQKEYRVSGTVIVPQMRCWWD